MAKVVAAMWRLAGGGSCSPQARASYDHHHEQITEKTNAREERFALVHGFRGVSSSWREEMVKQGSENRDAIIQGCGEGGRSK